LEVAEDAHLTTEEATNYLKKVLGMEKNPTDGTSLKTSNGNPQDFEWERPRRDDYGHPWTTMDHRDPPPNYACQGRAETPQGWRGASMPKLAGRTRLI
jgi:hypothetical protein